MNGVNGKYGAAGIQNSYKQKRKRHGPRLPFEMVGKQCLLGKNDFFTFCKNYKNPSRNIPPSRSFLIYMKTLCMIPPLWIMQDFLLVYFYTIILE